MVLHLPVKGKPYNACSPIQIIGGGDGTEPFSQCSLLLIEAGLLLAFKGREDASFTNPSFLTFGLWPKGNPIAFYSLHVPLGLPPPPCFNSQTRDLYKIDGELNENCSRASNYLYVKKRSAHFCTSGLRIYQTCIQQLTNQNIH